MAVHENTSIPSAKQSRFSQLTLRQFRTNHHPVAFLPGLTYAARGKIVNSPRLLKSITHRSEGR